LSTSETTAGRPSPVPDRISRPFWDACAEGRLTAQRCLDCGRLQWPPGPVCPACQSWAAEWEDLSPTGTVVSFVVVRRTFHPAFEAPYVIGHVEVDGTGGRVVLISNIDGADPDEVRVGMPVSVHWQARTGATVPLFRLLTPQGGAR